MARVVTFLNDNIIRNLKELYKGSDKTLSRMIAEAVDIGCKVKQHQEMQKPQDEKKAALIDKHTEYLLKTMAIAADTYRCVRNNKSKYAEESIEEVLNTITNNTQNFINKVLGNG